MRVLICATASLVLIIAGSLAMDWNRLSYDAGDEGIGRIAIDLRNQHICSALHVCTTAPLSHLPGMFPMLAAVTLWSSLGFAALVVFQAGVRLLSGSANDAIAKLGYMFALTTISIAVATAYLFGLETDTSGFEIAANIGVALHRTWAPLTLIIGLIAGFATLYMAVAPDAGDLGAPYKPVTVPLPPLAEVAAALAADAAEAAEVPAAARAATRPLRPGGRVGTVPPSVTWSAQRSNDPTLPALGDDRERSNESTHPTGAGLRARPSTAPPSGAQSTTGPLPARRPASGPLPNLQRPTTRPLVGPATGRPTGTSTGSMTGSNPNLRRPTTAQFPAARRPSTASLSGAARPTTGPLPAARPATTGGIPIQRPGTGQNAPATTSGRVPLIGPATTTSQVPLIEPTPTGAPAFGRTKSGPIQPVPEHLRNRILYLAITVELTAGGIDARREDGTSRLVLWRDVVGVVVRRLPAVYDSAVFVDIVSTARSTLRIVPWTRLTGDPIDGDGERRPRGIVEHVLAKCPGARLDPATRQFLDAGEAAQLPDLETLRAHDARLA
jgi:hypothetical protein